MLVRLNQPGWSSAASRAWGSEASVDTIVYLSSYLGCLRECLTALSEAAMVAQQRWLRLLESGDVIQKNNITICLPGGQDDLAKVVRRPVHGSIAHKPY